MALFAKSLVAMLALLAGLAFAAPAFAIDLDSAKAQGLVGERQNGYVGIVTSSPTPELSPTGRRHQPAPPRLLSGDRGAHIGRVAAECGRETRRRGS